MQTDVNLAQLESDRTWPMEEVPLTFQIGIVASDGVFLASDLKRTNVGAGPHTYRSSSETPKIHVSDRGQVAYCYSGNDVADEAARIFCAQAAGLEDEFEIQKTLKASALEAIGSENISNERQALQRGSLILALGKANRNPELWCLDLRTPSARPIGNHIINGDLSNPAGFFMERYFPKGRRTIEELLLLAAHTVLVASRLNPDGISGLEMVRCTAQGFQKVSEEKIANLTERSEQLDKNIAASLGLYQR
jgi:hypothetical protein